MQNEHELRHGAIKKLVWKFCIPSIISMVVYTLYNIVDRIYIGRIPEVGSLAMSGAGITAPATTVAFAFQLLVAVGAGTYISLKLGEQKVKKAQKIFNQALQMSVVIPAIIMIVGWILIVPALKAMGADETTLPFAFDYLVWIIGGFIFASVSNFLVTVLRSMGHPQVSTVCNVIGTGVNIILDPIMIFGFGWGIKGAAIATVISQLIAMLTAVYFYRRKKDELILKLEWPKWKIDLSVVAKICQIGFTPWAMQLAGAVVVILINNSLVKFGNNEAVAAMTIIFSITNLALLPLIGFVQGLQPIIGYNYGAEAYLRVRQVLKYGLKVAALFGLAAWILVEVFPGLVVGLFTNEPALKELAILGTKIFLLATPVIVFSILGSNYFQYVGATKKEAFLSLTRQVLIFIPALWLMPILLPNHQVESVWWAGVVSDVLSSLVVGVLFYQAVKKLPRINRGDGIEDPQERALKALAKAQADSVN